MRKIEIVGNNYVGKWEEERVACRGVVIENGRILLSYETESGLWMIPGGGREGDESERDCCIREVAEETGYLIRPSECVLEIDDYYFDRKLVDRYFLGEVTGRTERKLTEREARAGMEPRWVPTAQALELFSDPSVTEMRRALYRREYAALTELLKKDGGALTVYTPRCADLWFRRQMMADPETMAYNHAWGGVIPFPEEKWAAWYQKWIENPEGKRWYRYLRNAAGDFVGEIAYHYDPARDRFEADVIIFAKYRGRGCGAAALELLCAAAKAAGIGTLYDSIAVDNPALGLFLRHGFTETERTAQCVIVKRDL